MLKYFFLYLNYYLYYNYHNLLPTFLRPTCDCSSVRFVVDPASDSRLFQRPTRG